MSMISVARPLMTAEPRMPGTSDPTSMSRRSSTMSTISSTTKAHRPAGIGKDQHRLRSLAATLRGRIDEDQRHQRAAILNEVAAVRVLDLAGVELLEPGDQRQRHGLRLRRSGAEQQHGDALVARRAAAGAGIGLSRRAEPSTAEPIAPAMPFGSRIMITEPSPRMVLPENMVMSRSILDIGFTTISSVWKTPSTIRPKLTLPTCITTMKPSSRWSSAISPPSRRASDASGSSLSRRRRTGVSLIRSM